MHRAHTISLRASGSPRAGRVPHTAAGHRRRGQRHQVWEVTVLELQREALIGGRAHVPAARMGAGRPRGAPGVVSTADIQPPQVLWKPLLRRVAQGADAHRTPDGPTGLTAMPRTGGVPTTGQHGPDVPRGEVGRPVHSAPAEVSAHPQGPPPTGAKRPPLLLPSLQVAREKSADGGY